MARRVRVRFSFRRSICFLIPLLEISVLVNTMYYEDHAYSDCGIGGRHRCYTVDKSDSVMAPGTKYWHRSLDDARGSALLSLPVCQLPASGGSALCLAQSVGGRLTLP